eukprot:6203798-Pleurochrysis_carterae.AAC.3
MTQVVDFSIKNGRKKLWEHHAAHNQAVLPHTVRAYSMNRAAPPALHSETSGKARGRGQGMP